MLTKGKLLTGKIKTLYKKLCTAAAAFLCKCNTGATIGAFAALLIYLIAVAKNIQTGLPALVNGVLVIGVITALIAATFLLGGFLFKILRRLPLLLVATLFSCFAVALLLRSDQFVFALITAGMLLGALSGWAVNSGIKKWYAVVLLLVVLGTFIFLVQFLGSDGDVVPPPVSEAYLQQPISQSLPANPATPGPYKVKHLHYGSGTDKQRRAYNEAVSIRTQPVNATPFADNTKGIKNKLRTQYWGFNSNHYPVNASVWYPDGEGPFPLVLIVHGNHLMTVPSEEGYEYLGRLLASKGYIVASIDENFLNNGWFGDYYFSEMFVRGWLLLQHLTVWRQWNTQANSIFFKKADLNNIVLIGHSRGGNAVATAAALNPLPCYPLDARQQFNFNFGIKGLVQIAPIDVHEIQQEIPIRIQNMNFLLLHGGYDQDMYWNAGSRFYNRVDFTDSLYHFKTALYIYKANHTQFNTLWGREDEEAPVSWLLNTKPILSGAEQRKIAAAYIAAFLDATCTSGKNDIPLLKDYRRGFHFLPKEYYISLFDDTKSTFFAHYEEDMNPLTTSVKGGHIQFAHLTTLKEQALPLRMEDNPTQQNRGVFLAWNHTDSNIPYYDMTVPAIDPLFSVNNLLFKVCNNSDTIQTVDFTIELRTHTTTVSTRFQKHMLLPPPLITHLTKKNPVFKIGKNILVERVLQSVSIPLDVFTKANPLFNPKELTGIRFVFDKTPTGNIIVDDVGYN